ncbi:DUF962-domain-containing protein [Stereum hirsutum FP-91666 SS1]|uniref:DUF962-domain-containing protein n=1 Tax=Stereum hirsutum (strain FP-91666) TaxID=721885 RepID=UPI000440D3CA|nr:DUF962-domain-containing protein [Stereum hirsutum FP-91666 SS1]EIM88171.1 DUF962-domain-containing protein [Stereum hirsutum FP-91666 SS1]
MSASNLFNIRHQLTFYGAYHSNKTNIAIHICFVPLILWTFQVLGSLLPVPSFFPDFHYVFNDYMSFEINWATIAMALYLAYYYALEPLAALIYTPQMVLFVLTAVQASKNADNFKIAAGLNVLSWIMQFIGHGVAEKRAPALLDNLLGALVLAPFFVHLELLFKVGYKPQLHRDLKNDIGKEITALKKAQGEKRRAQEAKEL